MRTAEKIISSVAGLNERCFSDKYQNRPTISIAEAKVMISEARKEAIEECAEKAEAWYYYGESDLPEYGADKQSILSLISELK